MIVGGVHGKARGLIKDQQVVILIANIERKLERLYTVQIVRQAERQLIPLPEPVNCAGLHAVEADAVRLPLERLDEPRRQPCLPTQEMDDFPAVIPCVDLKAQDARHGSSPNPVKNRAIRSAS